MKMINVDIQPDFYFQLMRALDDAVDTVSGDSGIWSELIDTAFESIYSDWRPKNFESGQNMAEKPEDLEADELRVFRLGLYFGNWVAFHKGLRFNQCIQDIEKN
jgi:hypothetical protein